MRRPSLIVLSITLLLSPGCYLSTRMGPTYHHGSGRSGFEWDVTAGFELQVDRPEKINPLEGDTRVAVGFGGLDSSGEVTRAGAAPAPAPQAGRAAPGAAGAPQPSPSADEYGVGAAFGTIEVGHTLKRTVYARNSRGPSSGWLLRAAGAAGLGGGTAMLYRDGVTLDSAEATTTFLSLGLESGWHFQSKETSIGILFGTGVRYTSIDAGELIQGATVSPYVSVQIEGIALLQALALMLQAAGSGGGGCR